MAATEIVIGPSRATVPLFDMSSETLTAKKKKPALTRNGPVVVESPASQSASTVVMPVLTSATPSANDPARMKTRLNHLSGLAVGIN